MRREKFTAGPPTLRERGFQRGRIRVFDNGFVAGRGVSRVATVARVRTPRSTPARTVGAATVRSVVGGAQRIADRHKQPAPLLRQRHVQDLSPATSQVALHPAGVLLGPQPADHWKGDGASVRLHAHRAGSEPDPAPELGELT